MTESGVYTFISSFASNVRLLLLPIIALVIVAYRQNQMGVKQPVSSMVNHIKYIIILYGLLLIPLIVDTVIYIQQNTSELSDPAVRNAWVAMDVVTMVFEIAMGLLFIGIAVMVGILLGTMIKGRTLIIISAIGMGIFLIIFNIILVLLMYALPSRFIGVPPMLAAHDRAIMGFSDMLGAISMTLLNGIILAMLYYGGTLTTRSSAKSVSNP